RRMVARAVVQIAAVIVPAPDDHLAARPHRRVSGARGGRTGGAHCRPTVPRRTVAPAVVEMLIATAKLAAAPDDHLATRPHRGVIGTPEGRAGGAHWRPTVSC